MLAQDVRPLRVRAMPSVSSGLKYGKRSENVGKGGLRRKREDLEMSVPGVARNAASKALAPDRQDGRLPRVGGFRDASTFPVAEDAA